MASALRQVDSAHRFGRLRVGVGAGSDDYLNISSRSLFSSTPASARPLETVVRGGGVRIRPGPPAGAPALPRRGRPPPSRPFRSLRDPTPAPRQRWIVAVAAPSPACGLGRVCGLFCGRSAGVAQAVAPNLDDGCPEPLRARRERHVLDEVDGSGQLGHRGKELVDLAGDAGAHRVDAFDQEIPGQSPPETANERGRRASERSRASLVRRPPRATRGAPRSGLGVNDELSSTARASSQRVTNHGWARPSHSETRVIGLPSRSVAYTGGGSRGAFTGRLSTKSCRSDGDFTTPFGS
jgi:hypothetical protein